MMCLFLPGSIKVPKYLPSHFSKGIPMPKCLRVGCFIFITASSAVLASEEDENPAMSWDLTQDFKVDVDLGI